MRMVRAIGRAALQYKAPVAISAIDIAMLVDLEIDPGVAKRSRAIILATANGAGTIATDARCLDCDNFGRCNVHGFADNRIAADSQLVTKGFAVLMDWH